MALTPLQRDVCLLLADRRKRSGESYVAGGVGLNELLATARRSRDIDLFHDTATALRSSWDGDREVLTASGYVVEVVRERPAFVEATVRRGEERVVVEWSHDSAYRFFPLVEHPVLGLTMHPLDLATNKVLALVGRREVRDFVDAVAASSALQPLGYLAWAASGKDPGFSPRAIVEEAARSVRYTQQDVDSLDFGESVAPRASELSQRWHAMVDEARALIALLPAEMAGHCVLDQTGELYRGVSTRLTGDLNRGLVTFHPGRIGGSFPRVSAVAAG